MQHVYHFCDARQFKDRNYHNYFANPVRVGAFAVKLNLDQARTLRGKPDDFYFKYSLDKFADQKTLDLKASEEERLANGLEILKLNGDLQPILDHILMNKPNYLLQPRDPPRYQSYQSKQWRPSNEVLKSFSPPRTNSFKPNSSCSFRPAASSDSNSGASAGLAREFSGGVPKPLPSRLDSLSNLNEKFDKLAFHDKPGQSNYKPSQFQRRRKRKILASDFVSFRATMAILLNCQYDSSKTFTILAEEFEGTYYLKMDKEEDDLDILVEHNYARRKFEEQCTKNFSKEERLLLSGVGGDQVGAAANEAEDDHGAQFKRRATHNLVFMFSGQISHHSMLYAASMGCFEKYTNLDEKVDSNRLGALDFKTCKEPVTEKQKNRFSRIKTLLWWSQSVMTNAKAAVAFWKNDFVVNDVREYTVEDLAQIGSGSWNQKICLYQLNRILSFIKDSFERDYNVTTLKFHHEKGSRKIVCQESNQHLLPDYYKDQLTERPSNWRG